MRLACQSFENQIYMAEGGSTSSDSRSQESWKIQTAVSTAAELLQAVIHSMTTEIVEAEIVSARFDYILWGYEGRPSRPRNKFFVTKYNDILL